MSKTVDISGIDADDRFLIRNLASKKKTLSAIAKKLNHSEKVIEAVIKYYETKGHVCMKDGDFWQASFWFSQHKALVLNNEAYIKFDLAIKKCYDDYPFFEYFLDGERKQQTITDLTEWEEVTDLWKKKFADYSDAANLFQKEARCGKKGGIAIGIEVEELHVNATCKIQSHDGTTSGTGALVDMGGCLGILTHHNVLKDESECDNSVAIFELITGETVTVKLVPRKRFLTARKIGATFVGCDDEIGAIKPLTTLGTVEKACPIYSYFHLNGNQKVQIQQRVTDVKDDDVSYDGDVAGKCSIGSPMFCEDKLVGLNSGSQDDNRQNLCKSIKVIGQWIENSMTTSFAVGEEVMACWTQDDNWYNARIEYPTDDGYMVNYYQFDNTKEPLDVKRIKKTGEGGPIGKLHFEQCVADNDEVTTTATTTTSSTSFETTTFQFDNDDKDLINNLHNLGRTPKEIAKKLSHDVDQVAAYINSLSTGGGSDDFDPEEFAKVEKWLDNMRATKYKDKFKELGYDRMSKILAWKDDEIKEKLKPVGCKPGSETRILNQLSAMQSYQNVIPDKASSAKVHSVQNKPMSEDWKPGNNDQDLTEEFRKPDGSSSVGYTCNKIRGGYIPKGMKKGTNCTFYINSTRHRRYFKLQVTWN